MKTSAVDLAYSWIRERILDGRLSSGSFIDEATVSEAVGVSRTPAREAFHRLEGERFIERIPRRGAQVRALNSDDLLDAYKARVMVETFAAAEFCARQLPVPDSMRASLTTMDEPRNFSVQVEMLEYIDADHALHTALVGALENQAITQFFDSLFRENRWGSIARGQLLRSGQFVAENRRQHHEIVGALSNHDSDRAGRLLRRHLEVSHAGFTP